MIFALAGNQNCGKTTLFNQLTGSNQHVGNFPGVTVERKDGEIPGHLFALPLYERRNRHAGFSAQPAPGRHHQYRGRYKYRAQFLSEYAAYRAEYSHGRGA